MPTPTNIKTKPLKKPQAETTELSQLESVVTQINYIAETVRELKIQVSEYETKRTNEYIEYKVEHGKLTADVNGAVSKVNTLEDDFETEKGDNKDKFSEITLAIENIEKSIAPLVAANKVIIWIGGILGASVILFIWAVITHSIEIIHP